MLTESCEKVASKYFCSNCEYYTSRKSSYDKHLTTLKHLKLTPVNSLFEKSCTKVANQEKFICINCSKEYVSRVGLWKHKNKCNFLKNICKVDDNEYNNEENKIISSEPTDKDMIMMLIKDNSELKNLMIKVLENGTNNNSNNTINSHNKAFNLNFFLNETCKNAMNIMDFVESIQLQLSDLEKMGEIGYVDGISNIIVKNLNALDVTQRPVHCTDKKRETIYIKDEDKWEKDEEKNKIRKVIKKVATKNARLIQKFKEKHPDYNEYHSKYSTQYHKLIIESLGGSGDNDLEKEDKIIRNIAKNIVVDKEVN
jgi:Txe/YoeB family toxin of Txe-Axe toxin-antitoxin module